MVTKFGQFKKLKCPNFVNCSSFVTIFCRVLKIKIIFLISLAIPCPLWSRILWPINFSQKIYDSVYFPKKKIASLKWRGGFRDPSLLFSFAFFFCWKYTESSIFLEKMIGQWIPDCDGLGMARNIKKSFSNTTKNGNKVGTIYKVGKFQIFKLSKLCYHFLSSFENRHIFFDIPSNPPPIAVRNSLTD